MKTAAGSLLAACFVTMPALGYAAEQLTQIGRDQIETERHAMRLVSRPDVQKALVPLEAEWRRSSPELLPSTLKQAHAALEEMAFLTAIETIDSDPRRPLAIQISAPPHHWFDTSVPGGRWGIDNPDTQYFVVPLEAASSYVITGKRHAPGPVDSNFSYGTLDEWGTIANIGHDQLQIGADGTYTISLDDKPANGRANHIQLTAAGDTLFIRNTLSDWASENVDSISVKRVAGPPPGPVPNDNTLAAMTIARLHTTLSHVIEHLQAPIYRLPVNVLPQPGAPGDKAGFLVTQRNAIGHFRLGADDALVATIDPGGAAYTTFPITNVWGVTPSYWSHQSSLNNHQAIPNPNGTITVVLSAWDPGVYNWVDTSGLEEGFVMLRWQRLPKQASPGHAPGVQATVVQRSALAAALPPGMRRVSSAERSAQIAIRSKSFARRFLTR